MECSHFRLHRRFTCQINVDGKQIYVKVRRHRVELVNKLIWTNLLYSVFVRSKQRPKSTLTCEVSPSVARGKLADKTVLFTKCK